MKYLSTEHLNWIKSLVSVLLIVLFTVGFAGDFRWVSHEKFDLAMSSSAKALLQLEINQLDRQITFIKTRIKKGEATDTDITVLPEFERQLRELKSANP